MERSRLWLKKLTFAVFAISFLATFSHAQDTPVADVAVGYSPLYILKGFTIWMNGGSGSVAFNANDWFGVAGDFGAYLGHIPQSLTGETIPSARDFLTASWTGSCHSPTVAECFSIRFRLRLGGWAGRGRSRRRWVTG
jgi:hypothetical protein